MHSVPSATGSCAEDGDLVAGTIGGARHRTDQWIELGMRVHYTGSFCARPVKRTAIGPDCELVSWVELCHGVVPPGRDEGYIGPPRPTLIHDTDSMALSY